MATFIAQAKAMTPRDSPSYATARVTQMIRRGSGQAEQAAQAAQSEQAAQAAQAAKRQSTPRVQRETSLKRESSVSAPRGQRESSLQRNSSAEPGNRDSYLRRSNSAEPGKRESSLRRSDSRDAGARLYKNAEAMRSKLNANRENAVRQESNLHKPAINANSRALSKGVEHISERAEEVQKTREERLESMRLRREEASKAEAPHRPQITPRAQQMDRGADDLSRWDDRRRQRLHSVQSERQELEVRDCTFQPQLSSGTERIARRSGSAAALSRIQRLTQGAHGERPRLEERRSSTVASARGRILETKQAGGGLPLKSVSGGAVQGSPVQPKNGRSRDSEVVSFETFVARLDPKNGASLPSRLSGAKEPRLTASSAQLSGSALTDGDTVSLDCSMHDELFLAEIDGDKDIPQVAPRESASGFGFAATLAAHMPREAAALAPLAQDNGRFAQPPLKYRSPAQHGVGGFSVSATGLVAGAGLAVGWGSDEES